MQRIIFEVESSERNFTGSWDFQQRQNCPGELEGLYFTLDEIYVEEFPVRVGGIFLGR